MRGRSNKPKTKPNKQKKPVPAPDKRLKKELLKVYNELQSVANVLEEQPRQKMQLRLAPRQVKMARMVEPIELGGKTRKEPEREEKHLTRAITKAETWPQRDRVARRLAAFCYGLAKDVLRTNDQKNAQRWMGLSQRFFKLSMDPKEKQELEKIQAELDRLEEAIEQRERNAENQKRATRT